MVKKAPTKKDPEHTVTVPDGAPLWVERSKLTSQGERASSVGSLSAWSQFPLQAASPSGPTAGFLRVLPVTVLDKQPEAQRALDATGIRWWQVEVGTADGSPGQGWVCETAHLCSPWDWSGFELVAEDLAPDTFAGRHVSIDGKPTADEEADLQARADKAKDGPLLDTLQQIIDLDKNKELTTNELRLALKKPWLAQTLSRLIARYESEWGGEMSKWTALDSLIPEQSKADWEQEKKRIDTLRWWNDVQGKQGSPTDPVAYHFHPVGLIGNFSEIKKNCEEKFKLVSPIILYNEGGFVDDPDDAGGATNKGIAWKTWQSYAQADLGVEPTLENLKNLSDSQAEVIYRKRYWEPRGFCDIENEKTGLMIYDWTITSGKACREVQEVLVNSFGKTININNAMGKTTIDAINEVDDQDALVTKIAESRKAYYTSLTYNVDGTTNANRKFLDGWIARVDRCLRISL